MWADIGVSVAATAVACAIWGGAGLGLAHRLGRTNIVDTIWGLGFVWTAVVCVAAARLLGSGDGLRQLLLLVTVTIWGLRLSWYVGTRSAGKGDDDRYVDLLRKGRGSATVRSIALVFAPQSLALLIVSLPLAVGAVEPGGVGVVGWLGVAVWVLGLAFESIGDAQMKRFRADERNHGKVADVGLWHYTRHPNYFGDATVWSGIWLISADAWPGVLTIVSPILMTGLLAFGTGARLLEKKMNRRAGWDRYAYQTSGFVPMPPALHRKLVDATSSRGRR